MGVPWEVGGRLAYSPKGPAAEGVEGKPREAVNRGEGTSELHGEVRDEADEVLVEGEAGVDNARKRIDVGNAGCDAVVGAAAVGGAGLEGRFRTALERVTGRAPVITVRLRSRRALTSTGGAGDGAARRVWGRSGGVSRCFTSLDLLDNGGRAGVGIGRV